MESEWKRDAETHHQYTNSNDYGAFKIPYINLLKILTSLVIKDCSHMITNLIVSHKIFITKEEDPIICSQN
jgi:hypothetical protein